MSNHEGPAICYRVTYSTLTNEEENYDIENHRLTLIEEKDELIQNKKIQSTTDLSATSEDKAMEVSDKRKFIEQSTNDVYFIKKIKGHRVKNEQNVGNKSKGRISKQVLQKNKARQIF